MTDVTIEASTPASVVVEQSLAELNIHATIKLTEIEQNVHVVEIDAKPVPVVDISARGLTGPPGTSGNGGGTFLATAGEEIHGDRVVRIANALIYHPSIANPAHAIQAIGIATQSGGPGASLVVRTAGQITDGTWSWSPGFIWCADDGVLTQSPPLTGWILKVANVISATTIEVDIDTPFFRS